MPTKTKLEKYQKVTVATQSKNKSHTQPSRHTLTQTHKHSEVKQRKKILIIIDIEQKKPTENKINLKQA